MTERRPLVRIGGRLKDLPAGDTLPDRTSVNGESGALTLRLNPAVTIVGAFDPTNSAPTATFSNGGRTVTFASHTIARVAATQPAHPGGAVRYFEMTFVSGANNGDCAVGVVGAGTDISHQIGYDGEVHEVGMFQNTGRIYSANVLQMTNGAFSTVGDTVGVAVNATTRQVWFRTNGSDWNGDDLANPLTGVGGITIQGTGPIFPAVCSPAVATFTFDPAATFPGATPWGEYSVDGAVSPTDVALDNPVAGQVLMFNGVAWENADAPAGGGGMLYRKQQVFTSSGTFTLPATALPSVDYVVMGAGAGGSSNSIDSAALGGGGGQYVEGIAELVPGNTYSIVVGAGGAGVSGTTVGGNGGASEIAGVALANGGYGDGRAGHGQLVSFTQDSINPNGGATGFGQSTSPLPAQTGPGGTCSAGASIHRNTPNTASVIGIPGINGGTSANNNSDDPPAAGGGSAPGCGGGARTHSSNPGRKSGNGFRGEVRIVYWDTTP